MTTIETAAAKTMPMIILNLRFSSIPVSVSPKSVEDMKAVGVDETSKAGEDEL